MARPTAITRQAAARVAAAPPLTLDDRLNLAHHTMDDRLATRTAAWAVDTAHIPLEAPELLAPALVSSYSTPVAAVLQEAHRLITDRGWCRRWLTGPDGGHCLIGAIRTAADGEGPLADQAEAVLLEVIGGDSIARWNGSQTGPRAALAALEQAARHADRRGI